MLFFWAQRFTPSSRRYGNRLGSSLVGVQEADAAYRKTGKSFARLNCLSRQSETGKLLSLGEPP